MKPYKVNIVTLNYNGLDLLKQNLPSLVAAAKASTHICRVTVLDNCSVDGSVEYVRNQFPSVQIFLAAENKVLCSFNDLAKAVDDDILILLNNDVSVDVSLVDPIVVTFEQNKNAFFVSTYGDRTVPTFHWGIITAEFSLPKHYSRESRVMYTVNTGMGAFDRVKFLELGGYDELYLPGRYEDLDICYRGWRRSWQGYCQPKSRIFHEGQVSFDKYYTSKQIQRLVFRNSLIFMVKNISNPYLLGRFFVLTCFRMTFYFILMRWYMLRGFFDFLKMLPKVLSTRKKVKSFSQLSDEAVLKIFRAQESV